MPAEATCTGGATETVDGIPLYLIPRAIAEQIKKRRETVFSIRVERRFNHRYTIIVVARTEQETMAKQEEGARPGGGGAPVLTAAEKKNDRGRGDCKSGVD